jgi:hypothetical protein
MSSTSQQSLRDILRGAAQHDDRELLWMLIALLGFDVVVAAGLSLFPIFAAWLYFIVAIMFGGTALLIAGLLRLKSHYSVAGIFWFMATIGLFQLWCVIVMWAGVLTGWWASNQPGYHLALSAAVGLVPLGIGTWLLGRKLRQTR